MKKILIFLTILGGSLFSFLPNVFAQTVQFYEADHIPTAFVVREKNGIHYYQQGRFFKRKDNYQIGYCLQPFNDFSADASYEIQEKLNSLDDETIRKLKETVAFGYPIATMDPVYYVATQLRIWKIVEPEYDYYFTDGLNGPRTDKYDHFFDLLDRDIETYTKPSFNNQAYKTTTNGDVQVEMPTNERYEDVIQTDISYERNGNTVTFKNIPKGTHTIQVTRKFKKRTNTPILFYYHATSQLLMTIGDLEDMQFSFTIEATDTSIHVVKIDKDTKSKIASGDASLMGASLELFDSQNKKIATVTLDKNLEATISVQEGNVDYLPFGTYTLKEVKAGKGYLINQQGIQVTIDEKNPHVEVKFENQVIQNQVTIQKYFGDQQILKGEANIIFEIYNQKNELVKTIVTNQEGLATFSLPYGTYKVHQKTTTEGYKKVDDFQIQVTKDGEKQHFTLQDIKEEEEKPVEPSIEIEVPNTHSQSNTSIFFIIGSILGAFYVEKKTWI